MASQNFDTAKIIQNDTSTMIQYLCLSSRDHNY